VQAERVLRPIKLESGARGDQSGHVRRLQNSKKDDKNASAQQTSDGCTGLPPEAPLLSALWESLRGLVEET